MELQINLDSDLQPESAKQLQQDEIQNYSAELEQFAAFKMSILGGKVSEKDAKQHAQHVRIFL